MIVPSLRGGGLERMAVDLALSLRGHGWEPGVFPIGGLGVFEQELRAAAITVVDCKEPAVRVRGYPRTLIRALRSFAPAVIHAHSGGWYPAVVARMRLRALGLVFTDHGRYPPESRLRSFIERRLATRTDALVAVTPPLAAYVRDFLKLETPPSVIANGIDPARYRIDPDTRTRLRAEWGAAPGDTVFIAVGRLVEVKNHALLIDAFAVARGVQKNSILVILGQGPLEGALRQRARERGVEDRVRFAGFRPDVAACLGAADVWVSSSTTEGLPVSLLEAFAAGRPVIATAVGGIPDALGTPQAGLLVPSEDAGAMAESMVKMMTDEGLRVSFQRLSEQRSRHYSLDAMTAAYAGVYDAVIQGLRGHAT